jgi:hypothetical protein
MCSIKVPIEILNQIDKYRRHYLWNGGDINGREASLVAWKKVTRPKMKGGLGVIKLRVQNEALLLKNLHKLFNKADLLWVHLIWSQYYSNGKLPSQMPKGSFWWRGMLKLLTQFKGLGYGIPKSGETILLWKDLWNGRVLEHSFPELYSFAINKDISISLAKNQESIQDLFITPLSEEAFAQFCELDIILQALPHDEEPDQWTYLWGNGQFSAKNATIYSLDLIQFTHPSNGYGNLAAKPNTKFSIGSY